MREDKKFTYYLVEKPDTHISQIALIETKNNRG